MENLIKGDVAFLLRNFTPVKIIYTEKKIKNLDAGKSTETDSFHYATDTSSVNGAPLSAFFKEDQLKELIDAKKNVESGNFEINISSTKDLSIVQKSLAEALKRVIIDHLEKCIDNHVKEPFLDYAEWQLEK